jgi:hypothetical protein
MRSRYIGGLELLETGDDRRQELAAGRYDLPYTGLALAYCLNGAVFFTRLYCVQIGSRQVMGLDRLLAESFRANRENARSL